MSEKIHCLIIGSGPAGYTAAIYAARANLTPVLYEGMLPGGQLTATTDIENFPGYPDGVSGMQMMDDLRRQAERFGAEIRYGSVTSVNFAAAPYIVVIDNETELVAHTVIIATGASAKYLGLPDEQKYAGSGVSACAVCDGFFYRNRVVAVVGGGDTACEEAIYLAGLAKKVYMIVRKNYLRASTIMQERVMRHEKIEILFETETLGLTGDGVVQGVDVVQHKETPMETKQHLEIDGFFLAIGHKPNSEVFKNWLATDEVGYIKTLNGTPKTAVEGVFAAGDVADSNYRQAVTAAASGCKAAIEAEKYLTQKRICNA
ncbi:MAG: thioredoxin-disulfide reductase [Prevotellaceae bacterium]|jgi:thioredoxin reductase (NADPH)|nr:thioredoxin-disulfide reductase [Prevotellaceae bacterium]